MLPCLFFLVCHVAGYSRQHASTILLVCMRVASVGFCFLGLDGSLIVNRVLLLRLILFFTYVCSGGGHRSCVYILTLSLYSPGGIRSMRLALFAEKLSRTTFFFVTGALKEGSSNTTSRRALMFFFTN